jgi:hypothetical protein
VDRSRYTRNDFVTEFGGLIDVQEKGAANLMALEQIHHAANTVASRLTGKLSKDVVPRLSAASGLNVDSEKKCCLHCAKSGRGRTIHHQYPTIKALIVLAIPKSRSAIRHPVPMSFGGLGQKHLISPRSSGAPSDHRLRRCSLRHPVSAVPLSRE